MLFVRGSSDYTHRDEKIGMCVHVCGGVCVCVCVVVGGGGGSEVIIRIQMTKHTSLLAYVYCTIHSITPSQQQLV